MMENSARVVRRRGHYDRGEPDPPHSEFWDGARVREIRRALGMTVIEVADLTGLGPNTISNVELNRTVSPDIVLLRRIAIALEVSMATLLGETGEGEEFQAGYTAAILDMQDSLHALRRPRPT